MTHSNAETRGWKRWVLERENERHNTQKAKSIILLIKTQREVCCRVLFFFFVWVDLLLVLSLLYDILLMVLKGNIKNSYSISVTLATSGEPWISKSNPSSDQKIYKIVFKIKNWNTEQLCVSYYCPEVALLVTLLFNLYTQFCYIYHS